MVSSKSPKRLNSGVAYLPSPSETPRDFITWSDLKPHRIWVHSRLIDGAYKQLALEVQWVGESGLKVPEVELKLRLELAKIRSAESDASNINATTFRAVPVGQIVEFHSQMLALQSRKLSANNKKRVSLVKDVVWEAFNFENLKPIEMRLLKDESNFPKVEPRPANLELTANSRDSLFIASVYAEQVKMGSRQAALRTASLLGIKVSLVYVAVRTARKKGWLTSSGINGEVSGDLTKSGKQEYERIGGKAMYEEHITEVFEEMKLGEPI